MKSPVIAKVARAVAKDFGYDVLNDMEGLLAQDNQQPNQFGIGDITSLADNILSICASLLTLFIALRQKKPDVPTIIVIKEACAATEKKVLGGDLSPEDYEERKPVLDKVCRHFEEIVKDENPASFSEEKK